MSSTQKIVGDVALGALVSDIKTALGTKANSADVYTKTATDEKLDKKANTEGEYDYLTSGLANNLKTDKGATDKTPYLFRKSGGSVTVGEYANDKLVGGTVAWNQLFPIMSETHSETGWNSTFGNDGSVTINVTNNTASASYPNITHLNANTFINGHKYAFLGSTANINFQLKGFYIGGNTIFSCPTPFYNNIGVGFTNLAKGTYKCYLQLFDLTAMFGSTIADYIYSLEQATAGSGVNFFRKLFPKDYYAYNAGEFMSVKTSAHITRGFNAWDEETESGYINADGSYGSSATALRSKNYCPCIGGTTYMFVKPISYDVTPNICWYDETQTFIERSTTSGFPLLTSPANARYFKISMWNYGATYNHDICINISDASRNGEYEPYIEHNYVLDDVELRGLFKLDSNNKLYADGDTYESSGDVGRKYVELELGNMSWSLRNNNETRQAWYTNDTDGVIKHASSQSEAYKAIMSNGFKAISYNDSWVPLTFSPSESSLSQLVVCVEPSKFVDGTAFANWLSTNNVKIVIEAASETTETADPFTNPQQVDANGTEEYVDNRSVAIPVGHETLYQTDLKSRLENTPDFAVSSPSNGQVLKYDSASQTWKNANETGGTPWTDVTGTLASGSTSITLSNAAITTSSTIDVYTDKFGVNPTNVTLATGSVTLTFEAQGSNLGVKVRVS